MGFGAKELQSFFWRFLKFSINTCSAFVLTYPFASGVLFFSLNLYLFLPSVFYFLIYSIPFLACTVVFFRFYLKPHHRNIQHGVDERIKEHGISSAKTASHAADRDGGFSTEARRTLQRNVSKNNDESDAHAAIDEKNLCSPLPPGDFIGRTALIEEKQKAITKEKGSCITNSRESNSHDVSIDKNISESREVSNPDIMSFDDFSEQASKLQVGGEVESLTGVEEEESDDEEEAETGGEKAVEWTEYDQKNLMDLGSSELERNRRLESLIARRQARKLFKMNSTAAPVPIHPVLVARSNTFHVSKSSDDPIPGSAPSILLPTKNPFDLPYDPLEEKPDLMADSFHEEFMAPYQKESLLCRHESFSIRNSFLQQNTQGQYEGAGYSRSNKQLGKGDHDLLVDHLLLQGGETLRRNVSVTDLVTEESQSPNQVANQWEEDTEIGTCRIKLKGEKMEKSHDRDTSLGSIGDIKMDTDALKQKDVLSSPSIATGENKENLKANKSAISESLKPTFKFPEVSCNPKPNVLPCPIPKARAIAEPYDTSTSTIDKTKMEEHLLHEPLHTPSNSIASDMQVEVSEVGSPPLTLDGNASSNDDDDSLIYDGDSEKEITSGSDEMWGASPLAPKVQEHERSLNQIYEVRKEDITRGGFSGVGKEPGDPTASSIWSLSYSRAEKPQEHQNDPVTVDLKQSDDIRCVVEQQREHKHSNSSHTLPSECLQEEVHLTEDSTAHIPSEVCFQKLQESLSSPAEEMNMNYNADDKVHICDDLEDLKSNENRYIEAENSMAQEGLGNLSGPVEENHTKAKSNIKTESLIAPEKSEEDMDSVYNMDDSGVFINDPMKDSKSNEDKDNGAEKAVQVVTGDLSKPAVENVLESSTQIESESLNSPEKSVDGANNSYDVNDSVFHTNDCMEDSKSIEDIDLDSERQTRHLDIQNIAAPVEGEDNLASTQSNKEDQSTIETGVSEMDQSYTDPSTSSIPPEPIAGQASTTSSLSSSPKSVLAYQLSIDTGSTSDFSQLVMQENLPPTTTQNTSHVADDSTDGPSMDSKTEISEEPSNTQGKSTEEIIELENVKGSVLDQEETEEILKSRKNIDDKSETSAELSNPLEEINHRTVEHLEGASARLAEYEVSSDLSKAEGKHSSSKVPGLVVEEEDSTNTLRDVAEEVKLDSEVSDPSINENGNVEKLRSVEGSDGEPQFSTGHDIFVESPKPELIENKTIVASSKIIDDADNSSTSKEMGNFEKKIPNQEEATGHSETTKDVQGEPEDLTDYKASLKPSEPEADGDLEGNILLTVEAKDSTADSSHSVKESVESEFISNEKFKHISESKDESQSSDTREDNTEASEVVGVTNSESIRHIEEQPNKLVEGAADVVPSQIAEESIGSSDTGNIEDPGKSMVNEVTEPSKGDDAERATNDIKGEPQDKTAMDRFINHTTTNESTSRMDSEVEIKKSEASDARTESA